MRANPYNNKGLTAFANLHTTTWILFSSELNERIIWYFYYFHSTSHSNVSMAAIPAAHNHLNIPDYNPQEYPSSIYINIAAILAR